MNRTSRGIEDELLVLRAQTGDQRALRDLFERWQPRLWRHARCLTDTDEEAWDAAQDAWLAVVRGLARLRDPAAFRSWALRIVTARCADRVSSACPRSPTPSTCRWAPSSPACFTRARSCAPRPFGANHD